MAIGTITIDKNGQTVRLPPEAQFPVGVCKVRVRTGGREIILSPLAASWDRFFQSGPPVSDDFLSRRADAI